MQIPVWIPKAVAKYPGRTGFVLVDAEDAAELIKAGHAQDPRVGSLHLRAIEPGQVEDEASAKPKKAATYERRDLTAKAKK